MLSLLFISVVSLALVSVSAQLEGAAWSQCGGIGWSGATTCVSGYVCKKSNDYYSQCITGSAASTTASTTSSSAGSIPTGNPGANYWFSFGDSYTETGFLTNGNLPAVGNPLGNPPYPGYTATGGENWIDYDTTTYNKSLVLTYNYAYSGATIDSNLVAPYTPTVRSFTDQVDEFLTSTAPWTSSNTLFSVWIGINDIDRTYLNGGDRDAFSDTLVNAYFALVQKLVNAGARNFLFLNVPPIDRSPLTLAQSAEAQATEKAVVTGYNSRLAAKVSAFKSAHSGVQTFLWDSNAAFTAILDSPTTYGFVDATSYGNAGDFWANNLHPTSVAHNIFGKQIGALLGSTVW